MFKRIASNVITRLAVIAILAAVAFLFGTGRAHAQSASTTCNAGTSPPCDQGEAYAAAWAEAAAKVCPWGNATNVSQRVSTFSANYYLGESQCRFSPDNSTAWIAATTPYWSATCASRPERTDWLDPTPGDGQAPTYCDAGCKFVPAINPAGGVVWVPAADDLCKAGDYEPPKVDTDGDGEPDDTDAFPNDPSETGDSDGDGVGDNADFSPEDPTDGKDTDGEEDGDDEGDNQASGGGTCDAAPTCKGDGIACAQLFQLWRMRCQGTAQGKVTGNPQDCNQTLTVQSPDPVANAQLLALRKIACAQGSGNGGTGNAQGDANGNGVADVLEGAGSPGEDTGEDPEPTRFGLGINTDLLDKENIFGGGQCPTMPSFSIATATITPAEYPWWCDVLAVARVLIPLLGGWAALQILMGRYF